MNTNVWAFRKRKIELYIEFGAQYLAYIDAKKQNGKFYLISENAHSPLEQGFVLLRNARMNSRATAFKDFMLTPTAAEILEFYGFRKK